MGKQPVYYVQKSYRNEDGKPSTKYVERLGTLEDLEKRFGGRRSRRRSQKVRCRAYRPGKREQEEDNAGVQSRRAH